MTARASPPALPSPPSPLDWAMMLTVALVGGAAFAGIEVAIESAPPATVAAARLWIGAGLLLAYARARGAALPPLKPGEGWGLAAAVGLVGYALPFTLFPLAQQTVSSVAAGVVMAFLPLATLLLAGVALGERLTARKLLGFALGLGGVLTMIGPAAAARMAGAEIGAQLLLVLAVCGYATANVLMRLGPGVRPSAFAAMFLLAGAVWATPAALLAGADGVTQRSWTAILLLGLFPTGGTAILILMVVRRAGAGFFALSAYAAPLVALALGAVWLGEPIKRGQVAGLALILAGLATAGTGFGPRAPRLQSRSSARM